MTALSDFVLARTAEDEIVADSAGSGEWWHDGRAVHSGQWWRPANDQRVVAHIGDRSDVAHIARQDPGRALAECKAKREIVQCCLEALSIELPGNEVVAADSLAEETLRALARVYSDHPAFRVEWL